MAMGTDQGAGSERERVVQGERDAARERVRAAQDSEVQQRTDRSAQAKDRAQARHRVAEAERWARDRAVPPAVEGADAGDGSGPARQDGAAN